MKHYLLNILLAFIYLSCVSSISEKYDFSISKKAIDATDYLEFTFNKGKIDSIILDFSSIYENHAKIEEGNIYNTFEIEDQDSILKSLINSQFFIESSDSKLLNYHYMIFNEPNVIKDFSFEYLANDDFLYIDLTQKSFDYRYSIKFNFNVYDWKYRGNKIRLYYFYVPNQDQINKGFKPDVIKSNWIQL